MHLEHHVTSISPELCWALAQGNPAPNTNPPALFPLQIKLLPLWLLKRGEQNPPRRDHGTAEQGDHGYGLEKHCAKTCKSNPPARSHLSIGVCCPHTPASPPLCTVSLLSHQFSTSQSPPTHSTELCILAYHAKEELCLELLQLGLQPCPAWLMYKAPEQTQLPSARVSTVQGKSCVPTRHLQVSPSFPGPAAGLVHEARIYTTLGISPGCLSSPGKAGA